MNPARKHGVFAVEPDQAIAELEQVWQPAGYHAFTFDSGTWSAISSAGRILTGDTRNALTPKIRAPWQAMQ
jgi:hypothetical protein